MLLMSITNRYVYFAFTFTESIPVFIALPSLLFLFSNCVLLFCRSLPGLLLVVFAIQRQVHPSSKCNLIFFSRALILPPSFLFSVVLIKLLTSAYPLDEIDTCLFTVIITLLAPTHNACFSQGFQCATF